MYYFKMFQKLKISFVIACYVAAILCCEDSKEYDEIEPIETPYLVIKKSEKSPQMVLVGNFPCMEGYVRRGDICKKLSNYSGNCGSGSSWRRGKCRKITTV